MLWLCPGEEFFPVCRYFSSTDYTTPTVPSAGKDDVSFRASILSKATFQERGGGWGLVFTSTKALH